MHSSRMRTARLLPVSRSMHCSGGGTCPGGVPARGCTCPGGVPAWGVYLPRGVPACGVHLPRGGWDTWLGGVPACGVHLPRGGWGTWLGGVPAQVLPPWTEFLTHTN